MKNPAMKVAGFFIILIFVCYEDQLDFKKYTTIFSGNRKYLINI